MIKAKITSVGSYAPKQILTNFDIEKKVDTSDEWIRTRTGISERRVADKKEACSDLAIEASKIALKRADIKAKNLDLVLVATVTPDMLFPSTACLVQVAIGAKNAFAFDLSAACSGFIYGLSVAEQYIKSGRYKNILLVGSDIFSRIIDWKDRSTCVLFGDGAGAVIIQAEKGRKKDGILSTHLYSDGHYYDYLLVPSSGSRLPSPDKDSSKQENFVKMKGNETFKVAVRFMAKAAKEAISYNNLTLDDINIFIPHQANKRIVDAVAKKLNLPLKKVFINLMRYGNTSAASIPLALDEALQEKRIIKGDIVLLSAFGGGLTWGSSVIKWSAD
jgi:3-oxoacyl-[acyl-carrier-protein] synthase-3